MARLLNHRLGSPSICVETVLTKKYSLKIHTTHLSASSYCACLSQTKTQNVVVPKSSYFSDSYRTAPFHVNQSFFHSSCRSNLKFPKFPLIPKSKDDKIKETLSKKPKKKKWRDNIKGLQTTREVRQLQLSTKDEKNKETFFEAIEMFKNREGRYKRGAVEFVHGAMQEVKQFGVHRDLETYKALISLFPEEKLVAKSFWQTEFMHYPQEQSTCITMLDIAERFGVMPDEEMGELLIARFGKSSHVTRKYYRQMYWMPKFRHASPYFHGPRDGDLALLAYNVMQRICVDRQTEISGFEINEPNEETPTFIVSGQSPTQRQLLEEHKDGALVVEGAYHTFLHQRCWSYFVLRSEVTDRFKHFDKHGDEPEEDDYSFDFSSFFTEDKSDQQIAITPSDHEQSEGTLVAMAITSTASKTSLAAWLKSLEESNPRLQELPVYFKMRQPNPIALFHGDTELDPDEQREMFPEVAPEIVMEEVEAELDENFQSTSSEPDHETTQEEKKMQSDGDQKDSRESNDMESDYSEKKQERT